MCLVISSGMPEHAICPLSITCARSALMYCMTNPLCVIISPARARSLGRLCRSRSSLIISPMSSMFSTSTPESGSSNIMKSGDCASSCSISDRFTSPPEKPRFTSRFKKSIEILSRRASAIMPSSISPSFFPWAMLTISPSDTPRISGGC